MNRTVTISAADSGFTSTLDRISSSLSRNFQESSRELKKMQEVASSVFTELVKESEKQGKTSSDRLQFLQRELTMQERIARQLKDTALLREKEAYQEKMADAAGNLRGKQKRDEMKRITDDYNANIQQIQSEYQKKSLEQGLVRDEFNQYRQGSAEESGRNRGGGGGSIGRGVIGVGMMGNNALRAGFGAIGVAGLLSVAGFVGKMISEGMQLDESTSMISGLGRGASAAKGEGVRFGMKDSEFLDYKRGALLSSGNSRYDAGSQLAFEGGFSLDKGILNSMNTQLRSDKSGRSSTEVSLEMLSIFKKSDIFNIGKGDFTQLTEAVQTLTSLNEQANQQMAKIDTTLNTNLISLLGRSGVEINKIGQYTDPMNRSITSPGNDFKQAFLFRTLRKMNPNASLFDLQAKQEEGIFGEGILQNVVKGLLDMSGGRKDEKFKQNLSSMLGLQKFQVQNLIEGGFVEDAVSGKSFSMEDLKGTSSEVKGGAATAGTVQVQMAKLNNKLAEWGKGTIDAVERKLNEYKAAFDEDGVSGVFRAVGSDIITAITESSKKVIEALNPFKENEEEKSQRINEEVLERNVQRLMSLIKSDSSLASAYGIDGEVTRDKLMSALTNEEKYSENNTTASGFSYRSPRYRSGFGVMDKLDPSGIVHSTSGENVNTDLGMSRALIYEATMKDIAEGNIPEEIIKKYDKNNDRKLSREEASKAEGNLGMVSDIFKTSQTETSELLSKILIELQNGNAKTFDEARRNIVYSIK